MAATATATGEGMPATTKPTTSHSAASAAHATATASRRRASRYRTHNQRTSNAQYCQQTPFGVHRSLLSLSLLGRSPEALPLRLFSLFFHLFRRSEVPNDSRQSPLDEAAARGGGDRGRRRSSWAPAGSPRVSVGRRTNRRNPAPLGEARRRLSLTSASPSTGSGSPATASRQGSRAASRDSVEPSKGRAHSSSRAGHAQQPAAPECAQ